VEMLLLLEGEGKDRHCCRCWPGEEEDDRCCCRLTGEGEGAADGRCRRCCCGRSVVGRRRRPPLPPSGSAAAPLLGRPGWSGLAGVATLLAAGCQGFVYTYSQCADPAAEACSARGAPDRGALFRAGARWRGAPRCGPGSKSAGRARARRVRGGVLLPGRAGSVRPVRVAVGAAGDGPGGQPLARGVQHAQVRSWGGWTKGRSPELIRRRFEAPPWASGGRASSLWPLRVRFVGRPPFLAASWRPDPLLIISPVHL
jgi:hypothetical protein